MDYKAEIHSITDLISDDEHLKMIYTVASTIIRKFPCGTGIPTEEETKNNTPIV